MSDLSPEMQRFFRQEGISAATSSAVAALIEILSPEQRRAFLQAHAAQVEAAQAAFLPTELPEAFFEAFEEETRHIRESAEP